MGHLGGASGIAGVIKAILAVEKGIIPPNTNFERLNPQIDAQLIWREGQAAIQIAAHIGSEIFTTVGSMRKKKLLMDIYNLDEGHIFYNRDTSFADGSKRMTGGRGVDVVLNSLSGDGLTASWGCVAPFGRFLEIGLRDIDSGGRLPMAPFIKNLSFIGVSLDGLAEERPNLCISILQTILSMFEARKLHPAYPLHTYQLENIEKAFRFLQSGKSSGKIVLEVNKSAKLPVSSRMSWR